MHTNKHPHTQHTHLLTCTHAYAHTGIHGASLRVKLQALDKKATVVVDIPNVSGPAETQKKGQKRVRNSSYCDVKKGYSRKARRGLDLCFTSFDAA